MTLSGAFFDDTIQYSIILLTIFYYYNTRNNPLNLRLFMKCPPPHTHTERDISSYIDRHNPAASSFLRAVARRCYDNTSVPRRRASGKSALRSSDKHSQVTERRIGGTTGVFGSNRHDRARQCVAGQNTSCRPAKLNHKEGFV